MKYNPIDQDKIVVFYNDGTDGTSVPMKHWEFRFGGCKASKGFAPLYIYDGVTRELTALVSDPVDLPALSSMEFHKVAVSEAMSGGLWARLMRDEEVNQALAFACECERDGRRALFCVNRLDNFNLIKSYLESANIPMRALSGSTPFAEREEAVREFHTPYTPGAPVVLLVTDSMVAGPGWFSFPEMVLVHLDFPGKNPALVTQREARIRTLKRNPETGEVSMQEPAILSVSESLSAKINNALSARDQILSELIDQLG
jgi:hypothetical protein